MSTRNLRKVANKALVAAALTLVFAENAYPRQEPATARAAEQPGFMLRGKSASGMSLKKNADMLCEQIVKQAVFDYIKDQAKAEIGIGNAFVGNLKLNISENVPSGDAERENQGDVDPSMDDMLFTVNITGDLMDIGRLAKIKRSYILDQDGNILRYSISDGMDKKIEFVLIGAGTFEQVRDKPETEKQKPRAYAAR